MNIYTLILDITIIIVLFITIVFCLKLNNKIASLQNNKRELEAFIKSLNVAIANAHDGILTLKDMTNKATIENQQYLKEANELANDLSFMINSGNKLLQKATEEYKALEIFYDKMNELKCNLEILVSNAEKRMTFFKKRNKVKNNTNSN